SSSSQNRAAVRTILLTHLLSFYLKDYVRKAAEGRCFSFPKLGGCFSRLIVFHIRYYLVSIYT
ncbi:hypothetical protein, partial [Paenibacillus pinihumi]|uniref:hypothetical protein n=1 Tax=Paenibacillus pinihumi TaxID=669462 RepID=UPI001B7FCD57